MKSKLKILATFVMLAATVACISVNFKVAAANGKIEALNICATVFFLLFWALMSRFEAAAKTSALLALYTMASGIVAICEAAGGWANLFTSIFTAPAVMIFYGINFLYNMNILCAVISALSFVILIYSLITLANRKPKPVKNTEAEEVEEKAESIDISETELVAAAAEYVEMINTFENRELELPQQETEAVTEPAEEINNEVAEIAEETAETAEE